MSRLAGVAALAWLTGWLWFGRHAMLDDALIHLRYAQGLARTGTVTFDGATPSYGSSAPLYMALLAALLPLVSTPLLPKAASVAGYLLLLGLATAQIVRGGRARAGWIALVIVLLAPMGVRWLTDGMETSLVGASVLLLAGLALQQEPQPKAGSVGLAFLLGAILVLLRAELALAVFFAVLGAAFVLPGYRAIRRLVSLSLGGIASVSVLVLVFSHVLPDTAVAKRTVPIALWEAAFQVGRSTLASLSFGAGLALLWAVTLAVGLRRAAPSQRAALLAANLLFPCMIVLIAMRGQILHGVRHVLWIYLFLIAWNLRVLGRTANPEPTAPPRPGLRRAALAAALAVLAALWSFEAPAVAAILRSRADIFDAMRGQRLDRLADTTGAAYDIGFIAWFTGARILDASGLVNGRAFAALTTGERIRRIGEAQPAFLFVTAEQAASFAKALDLRQYRVCHRYRSANLGGDQVHLLAVRAPRGNVLGPCLEPLTMEKAP